MRFSQHLRRLAAPLSLVLALVACTTDTRTTTTPGVGDTTVTTTPATTSTLPGGTTTTTLPDLSGLDLPAAVIAQLEHLIVVTQEIRQLPFLQTPTITVVDDDELVRRVREILAEDTEFLPADEALYKLLGLLPADADLEAMFFDLYGEQVAGFYDGRTREVVVPARTEGLSFVQQGTLVHELVHALTDQHFDFHSRRTALADADRWDEATAYLALLEGDAMLSEILWVQTLSQREIGEFLAEALMADTSVIDSMPQFIRDSLLFPYDAGLAFVQRLYSRGGWATVNQAYLEMPDLPGSTEQIISPSSYARDLPVGLEVLSVEIPGYELVVTSTWGEFGLRLMFDQILGETRSQEAAEGWGGDYYHQWFDGQNAAFVLVWVGDTAGDLQRLRTALFDYQRIAIADEAYVWIDEEGGLLHFVVASEPAVGELIKAAYGLD